MRRCLYLSLYVYVSLSLSICLSICLWVILSIVNLKYLYSFISLCVIVSICLSQSAIVSFHLCVIVPIYLGVILLIYLSVSVCVTLSLSLPILSLCISTFLFFFVSLHVSYALIRRADTSSGSVDQKTSISVQNINTINTYLLFLTPRRLKESDKGDFMSRSRG